MNKNLQIALGLALIGTAAYLLYRKPKKVTQDNIESGGSGAMISINDAKSNIISMLNTKIGQSQNNVEKVEQQAKNSLSYDKYIMAWSSAIMRSESNFDVCGDNDCKTYNTETGL